MSEDNSIKELIVLLNDRININDEQIVMLEQKSNILLEVQKILNERLLAIEEALREIGHRL